jgi:hypothetical protein
MKLTTIPKKTKIILLIITLTNILPELKNKKFFMKLWLIDYKNQELKV